MRESENLNRSLTELIKTERRKDLGAEDLSKSFIAIFTTIFAVFNHIIIFLKPFIFVEYIWKFIPAASLVMGSEFLVDWFKHAFITKFNDIKPGVS